jgi:hypothetical protein
MSWTRNAMVHPSQRSHAAPALAVLGNRLHMVHVGDTSDELWHSTYRDGANWTQNEKADVPRRSRAAPALAAFGGQLHMVYLDANSDDLVHFSSRDGRHWTRHAVDPPQRSQDAPALAVFGVGCTWSTGALAPTTCGRAPGLDPDPDQPDPEDRVAS